MKRTTLKIIIGIVLLAGVLFSVRPLFKNYLLNIYYQSDERVAGVFSPDRGPEATQAGTITCFTAVFKNTAHWSAKGTIQRSLKDRDVLITVEPWLKGASYKNNVLKETIRGEFDKQIIELGTLAAKSPHQVFIRWMPDMEVPTDVYQWQFKSPTDYIVAFNYFAKKIKQYAPKVKMVWGPSGYPGDTEYYPGNEYVDYASITLGSRSETSADFYPTVKTVPEMLQQKLHRLRFINKPVLVIRDVYAGQLKFEPKDLTDEAAYIAQHRNPVYSKENYADSAAVKPSRPSLKVGVFDPNKRIVNQKAITTEHLFTDFGEIQRGEFEKKFRDVLSRHHEVIVTMEPWKDVQHKSDTLVMARILDGTFDKEIRKLFGIISSTSQTVYLRWMHEMEIPIHRYAWQSQDPVTYIAAYRYFMQFEGGPPKNVKKVWGPAGDRGSVDFWPGADVVDYISIAIYGLPDKNITDPEKQEAFSTIFNRKYFRMRFLNKPLFITEFGVKGPEDFQNKWLANAATTINANPHVFGVCYFNLYDNPKAWGNIKAPDWSITPRSMVKFCSLLTQ